MTRNLALPTSNKFTRNIIARLGGRELLRKLPLNLTMKLSKYAQKELFKNTASKFNHEEWTWLAKQREFIQSAVVASNVEELRLRGVQLLTSRRPMMNPVMAR